MQLPSRHPPCHFHCAAYVQIAALRINPFKKHIRSCDEFGENSVVLFHVSNSDNVGLTAGPLTVASVYMHRMHPGSVEAEWKVHGGEQATHKELISDGTWAFVRARRCWCRGTAAARTLVKKAKRDRVASRFAQLWFAPPCRIPPPKAVCPDLLTGVKSMAYVMRYNHFPH
ncbi:hypothetical protein ACU8OQ_35800 (plasmid) [Rhizobium leguminosarum]